MRSLILAGLLAAMMMAGAAKSISPAVAFPADQPDERWRCGPYHITIVPDRSDPELIILDDFIVTKNGRLIDYGIVRAKMHEEDGARTAWWGGVMRRGKYSGLFSSRPSLFPEWRLCV
jgi:hypothetical protein